MLLSSPSQLNYEPCRIISLVPSQTELLFDLGMDDKVIGITRFCTHPSYWNKTKSIVGGTKNIDINKIKALRPDLVIGNKEENVKEQIEALAEDFNVYVTDVSSMEDAINMITDIGSLTHSLAVANSLAGEIKNRFAELHPAEFIPTAYLIWRNPYMTVGGDTFINDMLYRCGLQNIYASQTRYPVVDCTELKKNNCKLLLLSSEPYHFQKKHMDELKQELPGTKILLVDGQLFSWYGSRLLYSPAYFQHLLQKEI